MARVMNANDWVARFHGSRTSAEKECLAGVSITLAAKLLGVSRSRVHQLINADKLSVVDVLEGRVRIGHLVTFASIERRRRTVRPRRTQWRSQEPSCQNLYSANRSR
jgi:hypothetical protein